MTIHLKHLPPGMKIVAKGAKRKVGMNRWESRYAEQLESRKHVGEVAGYWFEAVKFKLADKTFYTPDFLVMLASGEMECHEVKGFWREDARVKIKVAAGMYPFRFVAVRLVKKEWAAEVI